MQPQITRNVFLLSGGELGEPQKTVRGALLCATCLSLSCCWLSVVVSPTTALYDAVLVSERYQKPNVVFSLHTTTKPAVKILLLFYASSSYKAPRPHANSRTESGSKAAVSKLCAVSATGHACMSQKENTHIHMTIQEKF